LEDNSDRNFFTDVGTSVTLTDYSIKTELSENGSSNHTLTLGVYGASPLINAGGTGSNNGVSVPDIDQRGKSRVNAVDIGPFEAQATDTIDPLITTTSDINEGNTYFTVTIDEGVYNTSGGSGALEASDFAVTFAANGGGASGVTITSLAQTDDDPLAGGETEIKVNVSVTGTSNGVETFYLTPTNNTSIYDVAGNPMSTWQTTSTLTLNGHFDYYVDPLGTNDGSHGTGTGTNAWATIQYAITSLASLYDETITPLVINIGAGTYTTSNDDIDIDNNFLSLTLQGAGAATTIIQPASSPSSSTAGNIDSNATSALTLNDLTIRYGRLNVSSSGTGIEFYGGTLTINDCVLDDNDNTNSSSGGGNIYFSGSSGTDSLVINDSIISNGYGYYSGGVYYGPSGETLYITNSTFYNDTGYNGGGIYSNSNVVTLTNNTFYKGGCTSYGNVSLNSGTAYLKNNILANVDSGYNFYASSSPTITESYNLVETSYGKTFNGTGDITGDQASLNMKAVYSVNDTTNGTRTVALTTGSVAINAGTDVANNGISIPTTDQRGLSRVSSVDMGAFEFQATDTEDPMVSSLSAVDADNTYTTLTFDEGIYDTDGGSGALETSDLAVTFSANGGGASGITITSITQTDDDPLAGGETSIKVNFSVTGTANGVETFAIGPADGSSIYDAAGNVMTSDQITSTVTLNGHFDYYVDPLGTNDGSHGTSAGAGAWQTIQYAITNVPNPTTAPIVINIAAGTYTTSNDDIDIARSFTNLTLQGAGASTTIIQPATSPSSATDRNFEISSSNNVTLNDITIRYGRLTSGSGPGIYFAGTYLTINDCIIDDNDNTASSSAGGIYANSGVLTITDSTISNNDGPNYGGVYFSSSGDSAVITNTTFFNDHGAYGGGFFSNSNTVTITNCTFYKGGGTSGGNLYLQGGTAYIKNTIMADAESGTDFGVYSSPTINNNGYNLVESGYSGYFTNGVNGCLTGNQASLNMKSAASDNDATNGTRTVALLASSVAINAGNDTANNTVSIPTADQRSAARVSTVDMGAFEYQGTDDADPVFSSLTALDEGNTYTTLTFDEGVYNTSGGSGALEASDLAVSFSANGGGASGVSISSVTQTNGDPLVGGETSIKVSISITGTPTGVETFYLIPANGTSIYDAIGNAVTSYQYTSSLTLNGGTFNYYVDPLGTDDGSHGTGTGTNAWQTIQYAVTNVSNPTTVHIIINIAAGTYVTNNDDIAISRSFHNVTLQGASAATTIIKPHADPASATNRNFYITSNTSVTLSNMTIRDGYLSSGSGSAIYISSSGVTLNNVFIDDNDTAATYGGVYASNSGYTLTIQNSTISNNDSSYTGALYQYSGTVVITNSTFYNNSGSSYKEIYLNGANSYITNTIITKGYGIQLQTGTHYIKNSIIADNDDSSYDIDYYNSPTIVNNGYNIIGNQDTGSYFQQGVNGCIVINNNALSTLEIKNGLSYNNTLNGVPNLGVTTGSDVIDVGSSSANGSVSIPSTDARGKSRYNVTYDIGPYEYQGTDDADPIISTLSPTDGATGVAVDANLVITFDENVDVETGHVVIYKADDTLVEEIDVTSGQVTGTGTTTITVNPTSNFLDITSYYVQIDSTAFDDTAGNSFIGISDETTWNFTSLDATNPYVITYSPLDGATGVSPSSNLVLTFNENVDRETGNIYIKKTYDNSTVATISVTDAQVTGTGTNTITINPTADLGTLMGYYVQIDATGFDDTYGNSYAGITDTTTWNFTTSGTSGFTISAISDNTTEAGGTATFTVKLNTEPTANVTIPVSSSDTSEGTVSTELLTFTSVNWGTNQTVTVTGVNDDVDDGDIGYNVILGTTSSSDSNYNGLDPSDVSVTNTDNDTAGVTVGSISGNTTEAGGTATYTIVLNTQPTGNVEVDAASDDSSEGTVTSGSALTFTTGNWATPQTVTVTGVNDDVDDGDIAYHILNTVNASNTEDSLYDAINPDDISLSNVDNDTAGITVGSISGNTTEAGGTATYTIVLNTQPTGSVEVDVASDDSSEGTVTSGSALTFTTGNWSTPQTVTVTGVDDDVDDGDIGYHIINTVNAGNTEDAIYDAINPNDTSVTNTDNDTAGFTVSSISGNTTEVGGTATFTVRLNSEPTNNVSIPVSSSDTSEGTVSTGTLTFTSANWDSNQTVTVTGVNDDVDDGNIEYSAILSAATSSDSNYNGLDPNNVSVTNTDDDTAGFTVSAISGPTTEDGGSATFTVKLNSEPTADVAIPVSSSDTSEGTVSTELLTFTSVNWDTNQTVTVTGVNDDLQDGDISYSAALDSTSSSDPNYNNQNPSDVTVSNTDNDTAGFTISAISGDTTEANGTATFTVRLNTEPTSSVSIPLSSSDTSEGAIAISTLTFTTGNWSTPQTVTVTGVNDDIDDGNQNYTIILSASSSSDVEYDNFNPNDIIVINTDDDTAGFNISLISGNTTEDGGNATFTTKLASEPLSEVVILISSSDTSEGTTSVDSLTFTPINWGTNQTVTVTGVNDDVDDGNIIYSAVLGTTISSDANYNNQNPSDVSVSNIDNDTAGITVSLAELTLNEGGNNQTYTIVLDTEPTADVTIALSSVIGEITISDPTLVFTAENWDIEQTITVQAVDDSDVEEIQTDIINYLVTSDDSNYNSYSLDDMNITIVDNDENVQDSDANDNGIPDIYEAVDPTDTDAVDEVVNSIQNDINGNIIVTYADNTVATLNIFNADTSKMTKIKQLNKTGYVAVAQAEGKELKIVNILNGEVISSKVISKKAWDKEIALKSFVLQKKSKLVLTSKNKNNLVSLAVVALNTDYTLGKKASAKLTSKTVKASKTKKQGNNILLRSKSNKIIQKYLYTTKGKLKAL
jgi:hypothetical protein